jgi:predicted ArsR family transcriptional regulator
MKWKKLVNKQNQKHFAWPAGWDTAEEIAEQLECSPERVREHLSPSIKAGEVECKQHTIWDAETGRKITKTGFRVVSANAAPRVSVSKRLSVGSNVQRKRSSNKEIGSIVRLTAKNMVIKWKAGEKSHSRLALRRGDLELV